MQNEVVKINNQNMEVKECKGHRVVTFKDVDSVHERPDGTARRNFNANKKHLVKDEDYFVRNSSEAQKYYGITAPNGLVFLTEQGYLMLSKSFTDDLAWKVQRQLVKSYFAKKKKPKAKNLSSTNMLVKIIGDVFTKAGVSPLYIAVEIKRLYKEEAGIDINIPLVTDKATMPKLYDNTEMAKELGVLSSTGNPHSQAIGAILKKLHIPESEIVITAFSRNGHDDVTIQYKPSVFEDVKLWLEENNYPTKISYVDSKCSSKTCTVVYKEVA